MLTSLGIVFLFGLLMGGVAQRLHIPSLVGMLLVGMLFGPHGLQWLDESLLQISPQLRQLALIIILTRAGLSLDLSTLSKIGRPALLMCFVPACFELVGMVVLGPLLLPISLLDAAIMGAVVSAVSPAIIVPRMLRLTEEGWGTKKGIPQLIMAGSSVDDVFVIVLFTVFTNLAAGEGTFSPWVLAGVPISIGTGVACGVALGWLLAKLWSRLPLQGPQQVMVLLAAAFLLLYGEEQLKGLIPFSGLLAVMGIGIGLQRWKPEVVQGLRGRFSSLWVCAEVVLFVLVGAAVDLRYAVAAGGGAILLVLGALVFRGLGVFCCVLGSGFTAREKIFCILAYLPKATVQAAIGGVPLAMGLGCGQIVLTVAVVAIFITAPAGAWLIDWGTPKLLTRESP